MKPQPRYHSGDRIANRYLVHQALLGGMGEVYLCLDLETNYPYALKTFQQRYLTDTHRLRRAFEQEVATWVALEKHPNIVRCFAMVQLDYQPFMVLEWVIGEADRGTDLRSWLRHGPLTLKLALEIVIDICRGLIHAQMKKPGLVHRDLKPENILIAQGSLAKITDFGLAEIVQSAGLALAVADPSGTGRQSLVGGKGIAGTPAYMAPEQWRGEPLDERTDIYALGCILYELLTGVCPFQVDFTPTTPATFQTWLQALQVAHERSRIPALPAALPAPLNDLLQRCLAKAPSARGAGLADLLNQLNSLYSKHIGHAPPLRPAAGVFSAFDYNDRGNTYDALKQYPEALADYTHALQLDPTLAHTYSNRGTTYQMLGEPKAALDDFDRALQLDPHFAQTYVNRGNTYHALGQYAQALADFTRAIQLDANTVKAYTNRGGTYATLGQSTQALADFDRAIQIDASHADTYYNRGLAYVELERRDLALADFDRTLALDNNHVHAYADRGNLYAGFGQYQQALTDFDQALARDPKDPIIYFNRGNVYLALKQNVQAVTDYHQAITLDPKFAPAYLNLGVLLANEGGLQEALSCFEKAIQLGDPRGTQYADQIKDMLGMTPLPEDEDPYQQAFAAFQQADSPISMRQTVARYPMLIQAAFIEAIERFIINQVSPTEQPAFTQRLTWLRQIANTQPRSTP